jgi:hypothetical protein
MQNEGVDSHPSRFSKPWFVWKIIWAILTNLIYFAFLVLAFDKAQSAFQALTLCLLLLIYQAVNWNDTARVRSDAEEGLANRRLALAILQMLGEDTSEAAEEITSVEAGFRRINPIYYINLAGASIIYIAIVWKLATVLL